MSTSATGAAGPAPAGLSLPPKVAGRVSGHLVMKVDEVLWARKPPGDVTAVVMWWGAEEPVSFRPADVAEDPIRRKNSSIIYEIRTSLCLFEKYLQKCGNLEIAMADKYGMPIGCVSVSNLCKMISIRPYQNYYPIVNNFGNRIGDLHVSFNLRMQPQAENEVLKTVNSPNKQGVKTKTLKRLNDSKDKQVPANHKVKEQKSEKNKAIRKCQMNHVTAGRNDDFDSEKQREEESPREEKQDIFEERHLKELPQNRTSPTSNIISQILEQGTRLRNAMTASVMEDAGQLDIKHQQSLNEMSKAFATKAPKEIQTDAFHWNGLCGKQAAKKNMKVCTATEKLVADYLSGKPMSEVEERDALQALRTLTPTKCLMDKVTAPDSILKNTFKHEGVSEMEDFHDGDQDKCSNVTYENKNQTAASNSTCSSFVDTQLLSHINCLRVTVHSVFLNSIGIKRIGTSPQKKLGPSKSSTILHPPGVTYFVEYKFPLGAPSRPWESDVRYCSKRAAGHEVLFGDRTIHNLPSAWRNSISEVAAIGSLVSSLSFKVCARHLHQRVPISLGFAAPESAKLLIESAHLRHDFDLPVIATDHLPVAQLRVCLELGRDRIHFGGLFDPENNSLGIRSPSGASSSLKKDQLPLHKSTSAPARKKMGLSSATVTRNVSSKCSSGLRMAMNSQQAAQAERVIKKLVTEASSKLKQSQMSESSSAPSTARPFVKSASVGKEFLQGGNSTKPKAPSAVKKQFIKHEIALTFLQIVGSNVFRNAVANEKGFLITYKFPIWNAMKDELVEWLTFSTEKLTYCDNIWPENHSRIHTTVLSESESYYKYLEHAFRRQGMSKDKKLSVVFSICVKRFDIKTRDTHFLAEACLPLSFLSTLEDAYNDAARCNPSFSSSSCSSVVVELPLHFFSHSSEGGCLRLKLDYRHMVMPHFSKQLVSPGSRGDSVIESPPDYIIRDVSYFGGAASLKSKKMSQEYEKSSAPVPNWARSPDKKQPSDSSIGFLSSLNNGLNRRENENVSFDMCEDVGYPTKSGPKYQASWEPFQHREENISFRKGSLGTYNTSKSMTDLKYVEEVPGSGTLYNTHGGKQSSYLGSPFLSSQDLSSSSSKKRDSLTAIDDMGIDNQLSNMTDVGTCMTPSASHKCFSTKLESSIHKSTNTEQNIDCHDKSEQVTVVGESKGSQTTPRVNEALKKDVATSADFDSMPVDHKKSHSTCTMMIPQRSIDDVESAETNPEVELQKVQDVTTAPSVSISNSSLKEDCKIICVEESVTANTHSKDTESSVRSMFRAKVGVECALHLQRSPVVTDEGKGLSEQCYVFVSFSPSEMNGQISPDIHQDSVSMSHAVVNDGEPEWNWNSEVELPCELLISPVKRLVFKIWQSEKMPNLHNPSSCCLLGFSALDLTVLEAGLPLITGWFNIMDFAGACRGQIKLYVKPLEDLKKLAEMYCIPSPTPVLSAGGLSMYVAHCAYQEFPSHVAQFSDMCVQKVNPQLPKEATSAVLSGYQLLLQRCQGNPSKSTASLKESTVNDQGTKITSPLRDLSPELESERLSAGGCGGAACRSGQISESPVEVQKDPSILLREKLSELDSITRNMKGRLLDRVESAHMCGSAVAPYGLSLNEDIPNANRSSTKPLEGEHEPSDTCKRKSAPSVAQGNSSRTSLKDDVKSDKGKPEIPAPICKHSVEKAPCQKQRKMWERQGDLIDFGALQINCEDENEQFTQTEDKDESIYVEDEWLTDSALKQVFNPFLFNDILNNINPNHSVRVVEIDDTENSDDNNDLQTVLMSSRNSELVGGSAMMVSGDQRCSRRGDETYRKEMPHFSSSNVHTAHYARCGLSGGDADSGVDVDVSANFHLDVCAAHAQLNPRVCHSSRSGRRNGSSEREESSSCSFTSSQNQQSTFPSSLSASASGTPTDSPQRSRQAPDGCQNYELCHAKTVLGKRRTAVHRS